ncbi:5558_t:CDS:2 [Paraglomus brasilianum]|uniref:5558_t:CDS:1 n=1 Tax=Paraglomus brasilianum TaxID=144538 RepID=A0A9N9ALP5_9GLOM|nr:5558_t:CDS:2 [Paraglomus brasilianum]
MSWLQIQPYRTMETISVMCKDTSRNASSHQKDITTPPVAKRGVVAKIADAKYDTTIPNWEETLEKTVEAKKKYKRDSADSTIPT